MRNILTIICLLLSTGITSAEDYKTYQSSKPVTGSVGSIGSDTMNNMMALWLESFQRFHPTVRISIEGKGSSTAPPALIENTAQFAPMSRAMKSTEIDKFESKFGYKPTQFKVCLLYTSPSPRDS